MVKKRILAVLLAFSFVLGCMSPVTASAAKKKKYRLTSYSVKSSRADTVTGETFRYNTAKRQVKMQYYCKSGDTCSYGSYSVIQYSAAGQIMWVKTYDSKGNCSEIIRHTYDAGGRLVKSTDTWQNGEQHEGGANFTQDYDADGKLIRRTYKTGSDPETWQSYAETVYEYDTAGKVLKTTTTGTSTSADTDVFEYNTDGQMISCHSADPAGGDSDICQYDAKGRLIREECVWDNQFTESDQYRYNSRGQLSKLTKYDSDSLTQDSGNAETQTATMHYKAVTSKWAPDVWKDVQTLLHESLGPDEKIVVLLP